MTYAGGGPPPGGAPPAWVHGQQPPAYGPPPGYGPHPQGFRPGPPIKPRASGCLIAFLVFLGVGVLGLIGGGIYVYREYGSFFGGFSEVAEVMLEAQAAEGTAQLRDLGCDQAYAIDSQRLEKAFDRVEREIAKREGRAPKPTKLGKEAEYFVACTVSIGSAPSCEQVARTYIAAAGPKGNVIVQVSANKRATCSERFGPDGKKLGKVDSVDLP